MVDISIMIEGQDGLTWPRWKRLASEVESLGFAGLFRSDHFTNVAPPDKDSLEMIVSETYLASHTQRIHFGPMVAPISFREPTLLARQAAAIDDLSGGRFILGLGAGWQDREHTLFGHDLGDVATRMARLEEGIEVVTSLLRSDEPVTFEGEYFQLRGATLLPRPQRPGGPRILIGGNGPKRTLPLVARYADVWNGVFQTPTEYRGLNARLDTLLQQAGRQTGDVRRTMMTGLFFSKDRASLERRVSEFQKQRSELAKLTLEEALQTLQERMLIGTPDQLVGQAKAYAAAGAAELMLQWFDFDDIEGLRDFAASVLPQLA
jgi:F420-dependent oxidoreductase-like protein